MPKFKVTLERHRSRVDLATVTLTAASKGEAIDQAHSYVKWNDWSTVYKSEEVKNVGETEEVKEDASAVPA
jgi:hypothetical protein